MNSNSPGNPKQTTSSQTQLALNAFLVAADTLSRDGRFIDAELRLTEALALAQKQFGQHSEQAMLVLSITAALYRRMGKADDAAKIEQRIENWSPDCIPCEPPPPPAAVKIGPLGSTLGQKDMTPSDSLQKFKPMSHNIRRACQILGLSADQTLTPTIIQIAWKKQLLQQGAHPDLGGNTAEAQLLNEAKTELMEYLDFIAPRPRSNWKTSGPTAR
ncbi:MAG TPA: hypothetical protein V6D22_15500 [Candidatus Obscuribacterales bacterium]